MNFPCAIIIFAVTAFLLQGTNGDALILNNQQVTKNEFRYWLVQQRQEVPYIQDRLLKTEEIKLILVVLRHGDRTPILEWSTDPNINYDYGVNGLGELTRKGEKQAFELGKYLGSRYNEYFAPNYSFDQVYVQSSDRDRTISTAEMCVAGLFPTSSGRQHVKGYPGNFYHLNWSPIPLRTIPFAIDNKLLNSYSCPKMRELSQIIWQANLRNTESIRKYLSKNTGIQNVGLNEMYEISDTLNVETLHRLKLPEWTKNVYPEKLKDAFNLRFKINTATPELSRFTVGPLLAEFVQNMELAIGGAPSGSWTKEDLKYYHFRHAKAYIYSGHDVTIMSILNAFGLYDNDPPAVTSTLLMELHSSSNTTNEDDYVIKFFYKKQRGELIQELEFPNCLSPCTVRHFKECYKNLIIGDGQWQKECQI